MDTYVSVIKLKVAYDQGHAQSMYTKNTHVLNTSSQKELRREAILQSAEPTKTAVSPSANGEHAGKPKSSGR